MFRDYFRCLFAKTVASKEYLLIATSIPILAFALSCDVVDKPASTSTVTKELSPSPVAKQTKTEPCKNNPLFKTKAIKQILPYIDDHSLVVFDIDQTLIMDPKHAGNVNYQITKLSFVEPNTKAVLNELVNRNIKIVGLTARGYFDANNDDAYARLRDLGFDLSCDWLKKTRYHNLNSNVTNFARGFKNCVFYTNFSSKAAMLSDLLTELEAHAIPVQRIVFVDDSEGHCNEISLSLQQRKMNSCVFHYTKAFD